MKLLRHFLIVCITGYRQVVSPWLMPRCRYMPTCSRYAQQALQAYGIRRGGWLALRRLLRCHPFATSRYDPLPTSSQQQE